MTTATLTRGDCVIALRTAWERTRERMRGLRQGSWAFRFEFRHQLKLAYEHIRQMKAREAHKAAEAAREAALAAEVATWKVPAPRSQRIWEGPQHLLDARDAAELEVLRWEMADSFTATGNSRLFEAKARLAEIEAQLTWRTVA